MTAFLAASSLQTADSTAVIDWGWTRISRNPTRWKTPGGETVEYLNSANDLRGRRGSRLYLGYGWMKRRDDDLATIEAMRVSGNVELVEWEG